MINTFFNLGDTVYHVIEGGKFVPHRCELCNGTGLLTIMESDSKTECFNCRGRKIIEVWENGEFLIEKRFIRAIYARVYDKKFGDGRKNSFEYVLADNLEDNVKDFQSRYDEDVLFSSQEEAQRNIDLWNNPTKKNL